MLTDGTIELKKDITALSKAEQMEVLMRFVFHFRLVEFHMPASSGKRNYDFWGVTHLGGLIHVDIGVLMELICRGCND